MPNEPDFGTLRASFRDYYSVIPQSRRGGACAAGPDRVTEAAHVTTRCAGSDKGGFAAPCAARRLGNPPMPIHGDARTVAIARRPAAVPIPASTLDRGARCIHRAWRSTPCFHLALSRGCHSSLRARRRARSRIATRCCTRELSVSTSDGGGLRPAASIRCCAASIPHRRFRRAATWSPASGVN